MKKIICVLLAFLLLQSYCQENTEAMNQTTTETNAEATNQTATETNTEAGNQTVTEANPEAATQTTTETNAEATNQTVNETTAANQTSNVTNIPAAESFNISSIEGTWDVQAMYWTQGRLTELIAFAKVDIKFIDNSTVSLSYRYWDQTDKQNFAYSYTLYGALNTTSIWYFNQNDQSQYIKVLNYSLANGSSGTQGMKMIISVYFQGQQGVFGLTKDLKDVYDISWFLISHGAYVESFENYLQLLINDAFHLPIVPGNFDSIRDKEPYHVVAVYDDGKHGELYDWVLATCAQITLDEEDYDVEDWKIDLEVYGMYGEFKRRWNLIRSPSVPYTLAGFDVIYPINIGIIHIENNFLILSTDENLAFLIEEPFADHGPLNAPVNAMNWFLSTLSSKFGQPATIDNAYWLIDENCPLFTD